MTSMMAPCLEKRMFQFTRNTQENFYIFFYKICVLPPFIGLGRKKEFTGSNSEESVLLATQPKIDIFEKISENGNPSLNVFGWFTHLQRFYLSGTKIYQFGIFSG